jgi:hypothetical protein
MGRRPLGHPMRGSFESSSLNRRPRGWRLLGFRGLFLGIHFPGIIHSSKMEVADLSELGPAASADHCFLIDWLKTECEHF